MTPIVRPVILSGGAGTRLWPLSTPARPKQFLDLLGEPLIGQALRRLQGVDGVGLPLVVTGADQLHLVESALEATAVQAHRILVEPEGRNTGPAIIAAAACLDRDEIMVVLPADHLIPDKQRFAEAVQTAVALAEESLLVTFGIVPTRAETGYGYIEAGSVIGGGFEVVSFKEKPNSTDASSMLSDGRHFWNSGMFVFRVSEFLDEARELLPELYEQVLRTVGEPQDGVVRLAAEFGLIEGVSIDTSLMERTRRLVVVPLAAGWTDVGSFRALWEASERNAEGNVLIGNVTALDLANSYVFSSGKPIAVAGLDEVIVVETEDAILVVGMDASQIVKNLRSTGI